MVVVHVWFECVDALGAERPIFSELSADDEVSSLAEDVIVAIGKNRQFRGHCDTAEMSVALESRYCCCCQNASPSEV